MAAGDDLTAIHLAHGLQTMGAVVGTKFTVDSLRVAAPMRPVFERLMTSLEKRGLLTKDGSRYRSTPAFATAAD